MTTTNKTVLAWLDEVKNLTNPDNVVWIDGSEEQLKRPAELKPLHRVK